ncbi:MAG: hypothetical protein JSS90_05060 [Bacteroidetes bacterium]|jgi:hypothetical protein|nr:hypothetical protein [Bacteroidota bacterium]
MKKLFVIYLLIIAFASSCNLINPAEPTPSYLQIDTIMFTTDYATQGSASHKIRDAWIYLDNQLVGAYELPCKIPVLNSGEHMVSVRGGVWLNGISAMHLQYSFFNFIDRNVNLQPGQVALLSNLSTTYISGLTFALNEDFSGLYSFEKSDNSPVGMTSEFDPSNMFEGGYGVVRLDTGMYNFEVKSKEMTLPNNGTNVYLEMDYKNTYPFQVVLQSTDIFGNVINNSVMTINTREGWNKIYIELKPTMQLTTTATRFRVLFGMERTDASTKENFFFDNVKVIYN